ncbi:hypothetical protein SCACP_39970 [Sporomusa carbonis]
MKKTVLLVLVLFVLTLSSTVSARERHHDWSQWQYQDSNWHQAHFMSERSLPFKWHEHPDRFLAYKYKMERIHDRELSQRFPGLHAYKWQDKQGKGFFYNGHRIKDAILFYNDSDELVSVGFMRNGTFVFIRDDDRSYENRDAFFISWLTMMALAH